MKNLFCVSCENVLDCKGKPNGGEGCISYVERKKADTRSRYERLCDAIKQDNERIKNGRT